MHATPISMRVKRFGFSVLACGCLASRYREAGRNDVLYVEERGPHCQHHQTGRPAMLDQATDVARTALNSVDVRSVWPASRAGR